MSTGKGFFVFSRENTDGVNAIRLSYDGPSLLTPGKQVVFTISEFESLVLDTLSLEELKEIYEFREQYEEFLKKVNVPIDNT